MCLCPLMDELGTNIAERTCYIGICCFWKCMHPSILMGLLTRLGVHCPHIHFEGAHQGAASKQVFRMNYLWDKTTSPSHWVGRSLQGQGPLMIVLTLSRGLHFIVRYLAGDRAGLLKASSSPSPLHCVPPPPIMYG